MSEPASVLPLSAMVSGAAGMLMPLPTAEPADDPLLYDVVLHEPGTPADYTGDIVLVSTRVEDRFALGSLLDEVGTAAAIVLPPDAATDVTMLPVHSTRLFRRSPWVGWSELFRVMIRLLGAGRIVNPAPQVDNLQALARWISSQTGAPVTIEDLDSRVLAYAVVGPDVDPIRNQTILGGAVPAWRVERLMSTGFLPAVWRSDDVVVRNAEDDDPARMVVAMKSGTETLGTIWAALDDATDRDELRQLLLQVRQTAAAMMLREVHRDQYERRLQESALVDLLSRGVDPGVPAALLGLQPDSRHAVLALGADTPASRDLMFHVQALRAGARTARVGDELLVVLPVLDDESAEADLADNLSRHLARVSPAHAGPVAVGPVVEAIAYLRDSAIVARQVLDAAALRAAHPPHARQPVLTAADVPDALALVRAADLLDPLADVMTEPLSALRRHDTDHGTAFIDTVAAVLDHPGNLTGAARELGIHANSLRYRLDRIRVVSDIDLQSPAARLRAALGLLVWERRAGRSPVEIDKKTGSG
ncbi:PucR family transcriptional regulator [Mycolicibacterium peregrinum]|uniref:DNA-binding protein n=1 Tax=Mycolicibacterium peregrinum TaxID=43304 RepID=A0A4Z0HQ58_MYCPR|nr:PucR family transcriptional regulator [Mycolicibacterium peregrinum]TGB41413.1 DNA-binding protein [Mycolicibacterium peregrinum]TGB41863.1 DNA-binding protein [Mycolicibacterium peregrinum]